MPFRSDRWRRFVALFLIACFGGFSAEALVAELHDGDLHAAEVNAVQSAPSADARIATGAVAWTEVSCASARAPETPEAPEAPSRDHTAHLCHCVHAHLADAPRAGGGVTGAVVSLALPATSDARPLSRASSPPLRPPIG